MARIGGVISFKIGGVPYLAKGSFTVGYGKDVREAVVGSDSVHGFKTTPIPPFIEGEITDAGEVNVEVLAAIDGETLTLELGNGKVFALYEAWSCNEDGLTLETDESNMSVRFEGKRARDVPA